MLGLLGTLAKVFAPILKPIIQMLQPVVKAVQTAVQQVTQQPAPQPTKPQPTPTTTTLTPEQQKEQARLAAEKKQQQLIKEKELGRYIGQASGMDIGKAYLQPLRFPAELTVAAKGSLLAQDVLYALKHEGKSQHLPDEICLKRFARYGRDEGEMLQAKHLLTLLTKNQEQLIINNDLTLSTVLNQREVEIRRQLALTASEHVADFLYSRLREIENLRTNAAFLRDSNLYERGLEIAYGYNIRNIGNVDIEALRRLGEASLDIVNSINSLAPGRGLEAFDRFYSEHGTLTIYLGAEHIPESGITDPTTGLTPLQVYKLGESGRNELNFDAYNLYLGSETSIGTIAHEFSHQLDRAVERGAGSPIIPVGMSFTQYLNSNFQAVTQVPFEADSIYEVGDYQTQPISPETRFVQVIEGYVGQGEGKGTAPELMADLGMTASLTGRGQMVEVEVTLDNGEKGFITVPVEWARTLNATNARNYFENLLRSLYNR